MYFVLCEYARPTIWYGFVLASTLLCAFCAAHNWLWGIGLGEEALRSYYELGLLSCVTTGLLLGRPISARISSSLTWKPIATVDSYVVSTAAPVALLVSVKVLLHLSIGTVFWTLFERPFLNRASTLGAVSRKITAHASPNME